MSDTNHYWRKRILFKNQEIQVWEIFHRLNSVCLKKGTANHIFLKREFQALKLETSGDLETLFQKFDKLVADLRMFGCKFKKNDLVEQLLICMSRSIKSQSRLTLKTRPIFYMLVRRNQIIMRMFKYKKSGRVQPLNSHNSTQKGMKTPTKNCPLRIFLLHLNLYCVGRK